MRIQVSQGHRLSGIGVQLRVTAQRLRHTLVVIESNRRQGPEQTRGEPEPLRNQRNYRITDADKAGSGSLKQKCRHNLAATELTRSLEL